MQEQGLLSERSRDFERKGSSVRMNTYFISLEKVETRQKERVLEIHDY